MSSNQKNYYRCDSILTSLILFLLNNYFFGIYPTHLMTSKNNLGFITSGIITVLPTVKAGAFRTCSLQNLSTIFLPSQLKLFG